MTNKPEKAATPSAYDVMRKEKRTLSLEELQKFYEQALAEGSEADASDPLAKSWAHMKEARGWK